MAAKQTQEIKALLQAVTGAPEIVEAVTLPKPVIVAIAKCFDATVSVVKAKNAEIEAFKNLLVLALPIMKDARAWIALVAEIKASFVGYEASGTLRVTLTNNARSLCYGKAQTPKAVAIPARGVEEITAKIKAATSFAELEKALTLRSKVDRAPSQNKGPDTVPKETKGTDKGKPVATATDAVLDRSNVVAFAMAMIEKALAVLDQPGTDAELINTFELVLDELKAAKGGK